MTCSPDVDGFVDAVDALGRSLRQSTGQRDLDHLRKVQRLGKAATLVGLASAWVGPNPLSVIALAFGRTTRLTMGHHIIHRAYDRIPGVPEHLKGDRYSRGWRRYVDWLDWSRVEAWAITHNRHHAFCNHDQDPDMHCYEWVAERPAVLRPIVLVLALCTFKASYYSPRIELEWLAHQGRKNTGLPAALHLAKVMSPYALVQFALLPLLFLPISAWAAFSALCNSLMAEALANAVIMVAVGTSHIASDLPRFVERSGGRKEHVLRAVMATVDYPVRGDMFDLAHIWCGYQVAHHIWPDLTLLQYREAQPQLEALCAEYGIPYRKEGVFRRFHRALYLYLGLEDLHDEASAEGMLKAA